MHVNSVRISSTHGIISHRYMEFGRRYTVTCNVFDYLTSTPRVCPHIAFIFTNYNHRPHFAADNIGLSSLKFFCWARKSCLFLQEWRFSRSRSSKVIDFGTNRKRVCDFLLVRNSNLGPIALFRRFCTFLCSWPHSYPTLILGVFPLHQIAYVGVNVSRDHKLFGRENIFEVFQTVWKIPTSTSRTDSDMQSHNRALQHRAVKITITILVLQQIENEELQRLCRQPGQNVFNEIFFA